MLLFFFKWEDAHVHSPPIYGRNIKWRNSEEKQLMKWVEIFQGVIFWVGIFLGGIFLEPFLKILTWKNLWFTEKFVEIQGWLLLTFFICLQNQVLLIPLSYRCLKHVIHQIDSKNECFFLSVTFTAKRKLVFVLNFENAFP